MNERTDILGRVRVASPCAASWDAMEGDGRVRFCRECNLHVYNLSGMTRREAEALVANAEGRLCVRFYRRSDGTVITRNCPVGLRALKRRVSRIAGAALTAVLGFFAGVGLNLGINRAVAPPVVGEMLVPAPQRPGVDVSDPPTYQGQVTMGAVSITHTRPDVDYAVPSVGRVRPRSNLSK